MAKQNQDNNRTSILLRYIIIVAGILYLSVRIVNCLSNNCIVDADKWNARFSEEMATVTEIIPQRGKILASDGQVLSTNLNFYTARMDYRAEGFRPDSLKAHIKSLSALMAENFPTRNAAEWEKYLLAPLQKPLNKRPRAYLIQQGLSHSDMELMRTFPFFKKARNRTGLHFEKYMRRFNPYGDMARRSIGRVGESEKFIGIHGISGLECALDSILYGKVGYTKRVNLTKKIVDWTDTPAIPGGDIVTTIDIAMQDIVESELNNVLDSCGADWGLAILMDVKTGDIKAISNLERNPYGPGYIEALNRAVTGYEPGSVIKTLSMMIALEDGIVTDLDEVLETGHGWAYAGGRPITDSHYTAALRVGEVIEQSSNIGMARIITRRYNDNPGAFYSRIKSTGFLDPMHTGIAGERPPRIDSVASNRGGRIALSRQCYGYATEIPPIYTLALYNAIANNGEFVSPRLVKKIISEHGDSILPVTYMGSGRACSPKTAETMRKMLTSVVWGDHGTGRFLRNDRVRIAGKTGTCYMIENGQYNTSKKRLAFCGFFPAESPRYSCMVLTCHPTKNFFGAATTSGQVLRNVALKLYSRGLLDNKSEYRSEIPSTDAPTFFAHVGSDPAVSARSKFALPGAKRMKAPAQKPSGKGIPDVRHLNIREAIAALEEKGFDVTFSGTGYVASQTPSAGTIAAKGTKVHLRLSR